MCSAGMVQWGNRDGLQVSNMELTFHIHNSEQLKMIVVTVLCLLVFVDFSSPLFVAM